MQGRRMRNPIREGYNREVWRKRVILKNQKWGHALEHGPEWKLGGGNLLIRIYDMQSPCLQVFWK